MSYIKPLRPRFGVVTLMMACVFTAGWMSSLSVVHRFNVGMGKRTSETWQSSDGTIQWISYQSDVEGPAPRFRLSPGTYFNPDEQSGNNLRWRGFGLGAVTCPGARIVYPGGVEGNLAINLSYVRYRYIVLPLNLLSAWPLLSTHRPREALPAVEGPPR